MRHDEQYGSSTVLVTGGAGAIGSNLVRALLASGCRKVVVLDNLVSSQKWNLPSDNRLLFVEGDVSSDVALKRVFWERPSVVFHLAAFFANQNSVDYPEVDLQTNGFGTLRLLEYVSMSTGVKRFVYASSGCSVYGSEAPLPLREDYVSMHLSTPYQITKMLGELYCNYFHHHFGVPIVNARFFNSFGPGEVPGQYRNVIPNFIYWAMLGRPLPITGTGQESRDFTYVGDLVDGLLRVGSMETAIGKAYNLAGNNEIRVLDLATMVNGLTGNSAGVEFLPRRQWDTKSRILASIDKARSELGYDPRVSFREGLAETVKWFQANWQLITETARFQPGMSSAVRSSELGSRQEAQR